MRVASRIDEGLAFTRPGDTAGLLLEWYSKRQGDDPRWGAPEPPFVSEPVVRPTQVAFVGAIVDDPVSTAWHLGEVLDTDVSILAVDGPANSPRAAIALGDCVLALYPVPSSPLESVHVWGAVYDRARCLALGLVVADLVATERGSTTLASACTTESTTARSSSTRTPSRFPSCSPSTCSPATPAVDRQSGVSKPGMGWFADAGWVLGAAGAVEQRRPQKALALGAPEQVAERGFVGRGAGVFHDLVEA